MFEEARIPLVNPDFYESEEAKKTKIEQEKKDTVIVLEISPKDQNAIDL